MNWNRGCGKSTIWSTNSAANIRKPARWRQRPPDCERATPPSNRKPAVTKRNVKYVDDDDDEDDDDDDDDKKIKTLKTKWSSD